MIKKLGKYSILEKLGEGSMGEVYKAHDNILDRNVAIKIMAADIQRNPELKLRFYREAKAAAKLHHLNIVTIHELGEEGNTAYIVMELLQGKNLKDIIRDRLDLSLEKKLSIMAQVADGLACAHQFGFIHRDVKPGNLFVTNSGTLKILDFGIAHFPSSDLTHVGQRLGTPVYMSPEQLQGEKHDERSDMFSAGIVFYELLTYVHPFRDKDFVKAMDNILFRDQFSFAEQFPEAPVGLWPILRTCLAKDPGDRYPNMAELSSACRHLMEDLNLSSQQLAKDLKATLIGLRRTSEGADAPEGLVRLCREAQELLDQDEKADYLSLLRLKNALSKDPLLLRSVREPTQKTGMAETKDTAATPPQASAASTSTGQASSPVDPREIKPDRNDRVERSSASGSEAFLKPPPERPDHVELRGQQLLAEAEKLLAQEQFDQALDCLRKAIALLGPRESLVQMLADTRRKLEDRNRARMTHLLDTAREAITARQFSKAIEALDEAQDIEPNRPDAIEMRRQAVAEIEAEKLRQANKEEGEQEKSFGFRLLAEKKYRESLRVFRHAAELLGEDNAIRVGTEEAAEGLRAEELQSRILSGLAEAQKLWHSGILDQARLRVNEVLELSPRNAGATDLLAQIDRAQREKSRIDAIASLISQSEEALSQKDYGLAISLTDKALLQDASSTQIQNLIQRINEEKEQQHRREETAMLLLKAEEFLKRQDFSIAEESAREGLKVIPGHPAALECLKKIDQAREMKMRADRIAMLLSQGYEWLRNADFQQAGNCAREALQLEEHNVAAEKLLADADRAETENQNAKIADLISRSRGAMAQGQFEEATKLANEIFAWDAKNKEAKSLVKEIKNASRAEEKEQKRKQKELKQESIAGSPAEADGRTAVSEETLILPAVHPKKFPWIWICVAIGLIGLGALTVGIFWPGHKEEPKDPSAQLVDAKSNLNAGRYDKAIEIALIVLKTSPGNGPAQAILSEAQKGKKKSDIEVYMYDAHELKKNNQLEESLNTIEKILKLDATYQPALDLRSEIETQIAAEIADFATKEKREEEIRKRLNNVRLLLDGCRLKEVQAEIDKAKGGQSRAQEGMQSAQSLLAACKLDVAKTDFDRAARMGSENPDIPLLRKRIKAMTTEMSGLQAEMDQQLVTEQARKQGRMKELEARARQLFRQGDYDACRAGLNQLAGEFPQNNQVEELRNQANEALASFRAIQNAIGDKKLKEGRQALSRLREVNPSDPRIEEFQKQLESIQKSGKATLTILRLTEPGSITITLDDSRLIGANGEVNNFEIGIGPHKITVKDDGTGKQHSRTDEYSDGLNITFIYSSADLELRNYTASDAELYKKMKKREEIHRFPVEHPHGAFKGKCTGELSISGSKIEYKGSEKQHQYSASFSGFKLELDGEKLKFKGGSKNEAFPEELKARNKEDAKKIKELWNDLEQLGR